MIKEDIGDWSLYWGDDSKKCAVRDCGALSPKQARKLAAALLSWADGAECCVQEFAQDNTRNVGHLEGHQPVNITRPRCECHDCTQVRGRQLRTEWSSPVWLSPAPTETK